MSNDNKINWNLANFTWDNNTEIWSLLIEVARGNSGDVARKLGKLPEPDKKKFIRLIMRFKGIKIYNERKEVKNIKAYVKDVKLMAEEIKTNVQIIHG